MQLLTPPQPRSGRKIGVEMFPEPPTVAATNAANPESKLDRLFSRVRNVSNKPPLATAESHERRTPPTAIQHEPEPEPFSISKVIFSPPVGPKLRYFPLAGDRITSDARSRFEDVVKECLMMRFEDDEQLSSRPVTFKLIMAGSGFEDARPTIVISAPRKLKKRVRQIIEEPHMVKQYDPPFRACCLGSDRLFGIVTHDVDILFEEGKSLCACPVFHHSSDSQRLQVCMISCLLTIDGKPYALTAGHPFGALDGLWDPEGVADADDSEPDIGLGDSESSAAKNRNFGDLQLRYPNLAQSCRVAYLSPGSSTPTANGSPHSGTDWALLELDPMSHWSANRQLGRKISPSKDIPPGGRGLRAVTVMTSEHATDPLRGYICFDPPAITYHWDLSKRAFELWTVTPSGNTSERQSTFLLYKFPYLSADGRQLTGVATVLALIRGNSGALVIDSATQLVYGYVIGASPLGDLYVVPLDKTIHAISEVVGTNDVVFVTDDLPPSEKHAENDMYYQETTLRRSTTVPSIESLKYATDENTPTSEALDNPIGGNSEVSVSQI